MEFAEFVAARQRALLRAGWLLTGDWASAEDLVQTALVRTWPHWHRLPDADRAEAYVRRVMFTTYASWWRRRWRGETPTADLPDRAAGAADTDLRAALVAAVLRLPRRQRAVVVLRFLDDLTEARAAEVLGCSVGTVKSQTAKALATLRRDPRLAGLSLVETR
ncbi:MAG TPA: SigE family RNA polymerase sigma factor [Mycobacteriales bacterium]|jgi:RNA polymerase sigma-70 factor (sigma-E family)